MNGINNIEYINNTPFYFFYYYVTKKYQNITYETCKVRKIVKYFQYGIGYFNIIDSIVETIYKVCDSYDDIAFFCIPETTQSQYNNKYKKFSEEICSILGIQNAFSFVNIDKWSPFINDDFYSLDDEFFSNKKIIIFKDCFDNENDVYKAITKIQQSKANAYYIFSFAKKFDENLINKEVIHPFSKFNVFLSNKFEKNFNTNRCVINYNKIGLNFIKRQYDDVLDCRKITFGSYNNTQIQWEVIKRDNEKALIISEYPIECIQYNDELIYSTWETSSLRKWLNDDFYNSFDKDEQKRIIKTIVEPDKNPNFNTDQGNAVRDKIYIFSIKEYSNYLKYNKYWKCELYNGIKRQCWLRTCGNDNKHAAFIGRSGSIHSGGSFIDSCRNAIRPVMWIIF